MAPTNDRDGGASLMKLSTHPLADDLDSILEQTRAEWESLRGARIFLTGGTGFIGSWLLDSFGWARARLALDTELVVLTRDPASFARKEAARSQQQARGDRLQALKMEPGAGLGDGDGDGDEGGDWDGDAEASSASSAQIEGAADPFLGWEGGDEGTFLGFELFGDADPLRPARPNHNPNPKPRRR